MIDIREHGGPFGGGRKKVEYGDIGFVNSDIVVNRSRWLNMNAADYLEYVFMTDSSFIMLSQGLIAFVPLGTNTSPVVTGAGSYMFTNLVKSYLLPNNLAVYSVRLMWGFSVNGKNYVIGKASGTNTTVYIFIANITSDLYVNSIKFLSGSFDYNSLTRESVTYSVNKDKNSVAVGYYPNPGTTIYVDTFRLSDLGVLSKHTVTIANPTAGTKRITLNNDKGLLNLTGNIYNYKTNTPLYEIKAYLRYDDTNQMTPYKPEYITFTGDGMYAFSIGSAYSDSTYDSMYISYYSYDDVTNPVYVNVFDEFIYDPSLDNLSNFDNRFYGVSGNAQGRPGRNIQTIEKGVFTGIAKVKGIREPYFNLGSPNEYCTFNIMKIQNPVDPRYHQIVKYRIINTLEEVK